MSSFTDLKYHVIVGTKDRAPLIEPDLKQRLYDYMGGVLREEGGRLLAAGGVEDHAHMLVQLPATLAVADALRVVKTNSSRWVHDALPRHAEFAWQTGYAAFSVSHSVGPRVERYLAGQEEHHKKTSFQEEFVAFLQRHEVEYDPRYLWT
jgi:putative transposase